MIADLLPLAIAIAASPFPIIPPILLLLAPRGRAAGAGFLAGWVLGILAATTVFVLLSAVIELLDEPPTWASWARIVLGGILVLLGLRQWVRRADQKDVPSWMQSVERASPAQALRLGLLLSGANPKVLLLAAAAGLGIGVDMTSIVERVIAVAVFTALSSFTVALPLVLHALLGERIVTPLTRAKDWLTRNNATIMAVVIVVIGVMLVVKGVSAI